MVPRFIFRDLVNKPRKKFVGLDAALSQVEVLADTEVSGGNVTAFETDIFSLNQGELYKFFGEIRASATCTVFIRPNGNTGANYETANFGSASQTENIGSPSQVGVTGADEITHYRGTLQKTGNKLTFMVERYDRLDANNGFIRSISVFDINDAIETTSLEFGSNVASTIKSGSFIKIYRYTA